MCVMRYCVILETDVPWRDRRLHTLISDVLLVLYMGHYCIYFSNGPQDSFQMFTPGGGGYGCPGDEAQVTPPAKKARLTK